MKKLIVVLVSILLMNTSFAQMTTCDKCDIRYVTFIEKHFNSLNEVMVERFLCGQDYSCAMNPKFFEISSKTMYAILIKNPALVISCLEKYSYLNKNCIYDIIKNPANTYDFSTIKATILALPDTSRIKRQVANCVMLAGRKKAAAKK